MKTIKSKITNVTVFKDRAQVYRIGTANIEIGEQSLRFENLPAAVEPKSIQVNGKGKALLKNIKFKEVYHEEITDERRKDLQDKLEAIELQVIMLKSQIQNAEKEKAFAEKMAEALTQTEGKKQPEMDPDQWMKMIEFYRGKLDSTDKELLETSMLLAKEQKKIKKLKAELQQAGHTGRRMTRVVDVTLFAEAACEVKLYLSYIVYGASWQPAYSARTDTESKSLLLEYNAEIKQNTGEDWTDIGLKLSTAQVEAGGKLPELSAWYVNFQKPVLRSPAIPPMAERSRKVSLKKKSAKNDTFAAFDEVEESGIGDIAEAPMPKPEVKVEAGATSSVFVPKGKYTVLSDNLPYSAAIAQEEIQAEFEYNSVPKLSPFAFLTAKLKNTTELPFLPGNANVFLNNNFVAESPMKLVLINEKFEFSLGPDEGIKIDYKFINKYNKNEGLFNKKNVLVYEYETKVHNTKSTEEVLRMKDHIPVSQDEKIKVSLLEPKFKENTDELKLSDTGMLTRMFTLRPESEITVILKFEVEYPQGENVTGL